MRPCVNKSKTDRQKMEGSVWRDGSQVKTVYCRGPRFCFHIRVWKLSTVLLASPGMCTHMRTYFSIAVKTKATYRGAFIGAYSLTELLSLACMVGSMATDSRPGLGAVAEKLQRHTSPNKATISYPFPIVPVSGTKHASL